MTQEKEEKSSKDLSEKGRTNGCLLLSRPPALSMGIRPYGPPYYNGRSGRVAVYSTSMDAEIVSGSAGRNPDIVHRALRGSYHGSSIGYPPDSGAKAVGSASPIDIETL